MMEPLYEDNHLIAVYKQAGMLVQGDHSGDPCLIDEVKYYLKQKYHKPGNVFLGMLHRLDRPVSGIVLFAKTSKGASRLSQQFRERTIRKIYHAVVCNAPPQQHGTLIHYLKKDSEKNMVHTYDEPTQGALRSELEYEIVEKHQERALLKINLKTGRPHQIRAQLAHVGCPVVGDNKYGGGKPMIITTHGQPHTSIALAATSLQFTLATREVAQTVTIPIPSELLTLLAQT